MVTKNWDEPWVGQGIASRVATASSAVVAALEARRTTRPAREETRPAFRLGSGRLPTPSAWWRPYVSSRRLRNSETRLHFERGRDTAAPWPWRAGWLRSGARGGGGGGGRP